MVSLVIHSSHSVLMASVVLQVLGYCPPSGFYWSFFIGHSYSTTSRDTLVMGIGTTAYGSGRWPHTQAEDVLSSWMVFDIIQFPALSHAIICEGTSFNWPLTQISSLGMGFDITYAPGKCPPILYSSNLKAPLTYLREFPLAGRLWSCILQHR